MKLRHVASTASIALAMIVLAGCADVYWAATGQPSVFNGYKQKPYVETRPPGLYNLKGWNGGLVSNGKGQDVDIDGTVGHPITVGGPTASTVPSGTGWSLSNRIISGSLPPGLNIQDNDTITGIPTERGHWIVSIEIFNVKFNGSSYQGYTQQLRFHITGSGKVND